MHEDQALEKMELIDGLLVHWRFHIQHVFAAEDQMGF